MKKECEERVAAVARLFGKCRKTFTAIGDETRQTILLVLLSGDLAGIRVGEIAEKAHLTRPSVSHHLKVLLEAGIVDMRREGTRNYYRLSADETPWTALADLVESVSEGVRHMGEDA